MSGKTHGMRRFYEDEGSSQSSGCGCFLFALLALAGLAFAGIMIAWLS